MHPAQNRKWLLFACLAVSSLLVSGLLISLRPAEVKAAISTPVPDAGTAQAGDLLVVRVYFEDQASLAALTSRFEPWEVNPSAGYLILGISSADLPWLQAQGLRLEIDPLLTAQVNQPFQPLPMQVSGIPGYPCYRTVEETYATAASLAVAYPDLAAWLDIGDSWEKSAGLGGYDLQVLRLTNRLIPGPKPVLFVMTAIHARELATAELNTRFAEYLLSRYGTDPDVTWLLDWHEIHLLLQTNPDGRKQAEMGIYWRKNTNRNYCGSTSPYRGADLNRNFAFSWYACGDEYCSSSSPCDEVYRGPTPSSEPETSAVEAYVRSIFPDQRDDELSDPAPPDAMGIFLDIHAYGELVLWPWGFPGGAAPNDTALTTLGRKFAFFNGYEPEQALYFYPTDGTTDDFAYGELGVAAYTFEIGTSFFQGCSAFESRILPDNLNALLYAAKAARAPYLLPAGPEVLDITFSRQQPRLGETLRVLAVVDDTRYQQAYGIEPTQPISAARLYLDIPPWDVANSPQPILLQAADGAFDSPQEEVIGVIDTWGMQAGRHLVYLEGQDADGNWGVVSAAFLDLEPPHLNLFQTSSTAGLIPGETARFTVTSRLAFSSTHTYTQTVFVQPPALLQVLSATITLDGSPAPGVYDPLAGTLSFTQSGGFNHLRRHTLVYSATLPLTAPVGVTLTQVVSAAASLDWGIPVSATSRADWWVSPPADARLSLGKQLNPAAAPPGALLTYTLTATLSLDSAALPYSLALTDTLPSSLDVFTTSLRLNGAPAPWLYQAGVISLSQAGVVTQSLNLTVTYLARLAQEVQAGAWVTNTLYGTASVAGAHLQEPQPASAVLEVLPPPAVWYIWYLPWISR